MLKKIAEELISRADVKAYYMPQDYESRMNMDETPVEFLAETDNKAETGRDRTFLRSMKFTSDEMFHPIKELSGSTCMEKRRELFGDFVKTAA